MIGAFRQDLRYAARTLRQHPLFTVIAVGTLALGIGANTAIFSVLDAVALRPLAYADSDRLVEVVARNTRTGETDDQLSFPNYRDLRERTRTLTELTPFRFWIFTVSGSERPEATLGVYAGDSLFHALRVRPVLGTTFSPGAEREGAAREALLSYGLWQRYYGGAGDIVGRKVTIDGEPTVVVGVLPQSFRFPAIVPANAPLPSREPDLYLPVGLETSGHNERTNDNYWLIGRLAAGLPFDGANSDAGRIGRELASEHADALGPFGLQLRPLKTEVVGSAGGPLLILFAAVGLVLLIACANVGGLLLARAASRQREIAIRSALGASGRRLLGQLLSESLLLGLLGGGLGLLVAGWGVSFLRAIAPANIPRLDEVTIDGRVLLFALLASVVASLLFGIVPALRPHRESLTTSLRDSGRVSGGGSRHRVRTLLVVGEVALSVVLLTGAGMVLRSFARLASVDAGFDGRNVMTMLALLPPGRYTTPDSRRQYEEEALRRLRALPGVDAVGVINTLPFSNLGDNTSVQVLDHPVSAGNEMPVVAYRTVGGDYFSALRMQLASGRFFDAHDVAGSAAVAMINETAARKFFPGEDPLGRQLTSIQGDTTRFTIVGVLRDTHGEALDVAPTPEVTVPFAQRPNFLVTLAIRTASDPHPLLPAMRRALAGIDPLQAWYAERTLDELVAASLAQRRFNLMLLGGFAALALALAVVGLYGVVAFGVSQRSQEIGIRMALGADRGLVLRLVLREAMVMTGTGLLLGGVIAVVAARALSSQLYRAGAFDPVAFAGVVAVFSLAAGVASLVPARRATRIDPVRAIRAE
jgi:putative ABC transport system permease protein